MYMKTIFDVVNQLRKRELNWSEIPDNVKKDIDPWMLNKALSMNPDIIEIIDYVQCRFTGTPEQWIAVYSDIIPKQPKPKYNPWVKKKTNVKIDEQAVELFKSYYQVSGREVRQWIDTGLITKDDITEIKTMYGR